MKNVWLDRKAEREAAGQAYPNIYGFKTPERSVIGQKFPCGCGKAKNVQAEIKRLEALRARCKRIEIAEAKYRSH